MRNFTVGFVAAGFACLVLQAAAFGGSGDRSEWYTREFDGSTTPDKARGLRIVYEGKNPPSESRSAHGIYTMRTAQAKGQKIWRIEVPDWAPSTGSGTVEFRAKVGPGDGRRGSARFSVSNGRTSWIMYLLPNRIRCRTSRYGSDPVITLEPGRFHTVRLVIQSGVADVYVDGTLKPVVASWTGFGTGVTHILFGDATSEADTEWGQVQWDYIRWNNTYSVTPAQELAAMRVNRPLAMGAAPRRLLAWENQRLVRRADSPFPRFDAIVALINRKEFDKAFRAIEAVASRPGIGYPKAALAAALAGHPDNPLPDKSVRLGYRALVEDWGFGGIAARRLLHEIELYRFAPGRGFPTNPILLTTRDMVRQVGIEQARGYYIGHEQSKHTHWYTPSVAWALMEMFVGRPAYATLRKDAIRKQQEQIDSNRARAGSAGILLRLIDRADREPWASVAIPKDSPLYPQRLFSRMKAYYWWWIQMGERQRPMSKQGYHELMDRLKEIFPDSDRVQAYQGKKVRWGERELSMSPAPKDAPRWAVNLRELRARCDYVVQWWLEHRQAPNGALGGGWEDDCETLRVWATTAIICDNKALQPGIRKLVNGIWIHGGLAAHGYDPQMKDVEHSSEMSADSSVIMLMDYGDPLQFERFLKTTRTTRNVHVGLTRRGHLHFKSISMSGTAVREGGCDTHYHGRAMRPAALIAWYSGLPKAVKLLHDWCVAWSEDTLRKGRTKPADVMPAVIQFDTESFDGKTDWVARPYGELYWWDPGQQDMLIGKMLGAWALTGDEKILDGLRAELKLMRKYLGKGNNQAEWVWNKEKMRFWIQSPKDAEPITAKEGTKAWAGQQLSRYPQFATWYRTCTGDRQFDDILKTDREYGRYLVSGDPAHMERALGVFLEGMYYRLPMMTTELRGTDRVTCFGLNYAPVISAMTGSSVPITQPPMFHVTWSNIDNDFAALVRNDFTTCGGTIWVYNFADKAVRPEIRFWRLEPGVYELTVAPDGDKDGKGDGPAFHTQKIEVLRRMDRARFDLPAKRTCLLRVRQVKKLPPLPKRMPDLAIASRDLTLLDKPATGRACRMKLIVHNIGSARATGLKVRLTAERVGSGQAPKEVVSLRRDGLDFPADLTAKTLPVKFQWTPGAPGSYRLRVELSCSEPEIYLANNAISADCRVPAGP